MLKNGPQVSFEVYLETQKISKSKTSFQFHWLDIGDDFTHDSLRIWSWSFNINCRLYVGLQLSLIWISLIINGLRYQASSIWADRRWLLNWWQATVVRPVTEVHRRVAPRVAGCLPAQATSGQSAPAQAAACAREPPSATFPFLAFSFASHRSRSAATPRYCCRASFAVA